MHNAKSDTSERYNFNAFIERVKHLPYENILASAIREAERADAACAGGRECVANRKAGGSVYSAKLKAFIWCMTYFKPPGGHEGIAFVCEPIVKRLIQEGVIKEEALIELTRMKIDSPLCKQGK